MPKVLLAPALARRLDAGATGEGVVEVEGATVAECLAEVFGRVPGARGYVLDEQGALRHHVAVFVDGSSLRDKRDLSQPVRPDSEIHVMQALSGG